MTRDEAFTQTLDLFFRGGFALLRFYGIVHRRASERAGGSGRPAIFRISIADGGAAPDLNFKTLNRRPWL